MTSRRQFFAFLLGLFLCTITFTLPKGLEPSHHGTLVPTIHPRASVSHPTINLGTSTLLIFPNKTGSGNATDPFIIRDLEIVTPNDGIGIRLADIFYHVHIINCTITGDLIKSAIFLDDSDNIKVINCTFDVNYAEDGILVIVTGRNITVFNNSINSNWFPTIPTGFDVLRSMIINGRSINITSNNITTSIHSILRISGSPVNVTFCSNHLVNTSFYLNPLDFSDFSSLNDTLTFDGTNTINEKKLVYLKDESGIVPADLSQVGQLFLDNCSKANVSNLRDLESLWARYCQDLTFHNNSAEARVFHSDNGSYMDNFGDYLVSGITLENCSDSTIANNSYYFPVYGIYMEDTNCNNLEISNNSIIGSCRTSLLLKGDYHAVHNNTFKNSYSSGISIGIIHHSLIWNNSISNCNYGFYLATSDVHNNTMYLNYVYNNSLANAYVSLLIGVYDNYWDDNHSGNYWGDYTTVFTSATNDGVIWNQPYILNRTYDRFPLVTPFVGDWTPTANFSVVNATNTTVAPGTSIDFLFTGNLGNDPAEIGWNLGDGTTVYNTTSPSHQFTTEDTFTVTCNITDLDGDFDAFSIPACITVVEYLPAASFLVSSPCILPGDSLGITFTGSAGNLPATLFWDFGDGTNHSGDHAEPSLVHDFLSVGTFNVTLLVTDLDGDTSLSSLIVHVLDPAGDADGDGISNADELSGGTDPLDPDDPPPGGLDTITVPIILTSAGAGAAVVIVIVIKKRRP